MSDNFLSVIVEAPPLQLACQTTLLLGTEVQHNAEYAGATARKYVTLEAYGDIYISSNKPLTAFYGTDAGALNTQPPNPTFGTAAYLFSWYDPFARPRKMSGLTGTRFGITLMQTGLLCVWGSVKLDVTGASPEVVPTLSTCDDPLPVTFCVNNTPTVVSHQYGLNDAGVWAPIRIDNDGRTYVTNS